MTQPLDCLCDTEKVDKNTTTLFLLTVFILLYKRYFIITSQNSNMARQKQPVYYI